MQTRKDANAGRSMTMAQQDRIADLDRLAVDRTRSGRNGGSIGLVALIAGIVAGVTAERSTSDDK